MHLPFDTICQLAIETTSPWIMLKQLHKVMFHQANKVTVAGDASTRKPPYFSLCIRMQGDLQKMNGDPTLASPTPHTWLLDKTSSNIQWLEICCWPGWQTNKSCQRLLKGVKGGNQMTSKPFVCVCVVSVLWAKQNRIAWELYDSYIIMTVYSCMYAMIPLVNYLDLHVHMLIIIGITDHCMYKDKNISTCMYVSRLKHNMYVYIYINVRCM